MVLPQRIAAEENVQFVPPMLAAAAAAYLHARAAEHEQLALMSRRDLSEEWSDDVRATVLQARTCILHAQETRVRLRDQVRDIVVTMRKAGEPVPLVLRHTRSLIQLLEPTQATAAERVEFESEVLSWAIEDCESN